MTGSKYNNIKSSVQRQKKIQTRRLKDSLFLCLAMPRSMSLGSEDNIKRTISSPRTKKAGACSEDHTSCIGQLQSARVSLFLSFFHALFLSFSTLRHCCQELPEWSRYGHGGVAFSSIYIPASLGMALAGQEDVPWSSRM